jgi:CHAT domain-containing protein
VLNACQSAMVGEGADDPFSSVAAALLRSGMRSVVAMAYSLYVSGAQQFLPPFYRRLFEEGSMAGALRAGRQQMFRQDKRVCVRGKFPLQDWLLPVLYQQDPLNFSFAAEARKTFVPQLQSSRRS